MVGTHYRTVGRTVTEVDIIHFAGMTGMNEVLFTNYEYQKTALLAGRVAPAGLVCALAEGLVLAPTAQCTGLALLEMNLVMASPVFALDTVHVEFEIVEARQTSVEERGIIKSVNRVLKENGELVMTYVPVRMWKTRAGIGRK